MIVRDAVEADVPALTHLYNAWIPSRSITWTDVLTTDDERSQWLRNHAEQGLPVLVADDDGDVAGFASYDHFRGAGMPGYSLTVEHSVHVRRDRWGRGAGRALIEALIERARAAGVHVMVGAIDGDNQESLRFHARLGFVEVARMPQTGHKFGRWLDLVLVQRILDDRPAP
jgi:phosphinothricin acetyltransferase